MESPRALAVLFAPFKRNPIAFGAGFIAYGFDPRWVSAGGGSEMLVRFGQFLVALGAGLFVDELIQKWLARRSATDCHTEGEEGSSTHLPRDNHK